jgi:hypothetical protein
MTSLSDELSALLDVRGDPQDLIIQAGAPSAGREDKELTKEKRCPLTFTGY